jgi:peptide/nickel transport system permease protein
VKRRIATAILELVAVLFVVSVGAFLLVHLLPGDPAATILGPDDTPAARAALLRHLGLNRPLVEQYGIWLRNVLTGHLGESYVTHEPVASLIAHAFPVDLELVVVSQAIAFALAIGLALVAAWREGGVLDQAASAVSFGLLSAPTFVVGVLLVLLLAVKARLLPATGWVGLTKDPLENLRDALLPSLALAASSVAVYYRLLRAELARTLREDFVTLARAKGLSTRRILVRHALRPSLVPLLAAAGVNVGTLIGGAFIVEYLFALPGLGYEAVNAIYERDYLSVQAIVLVEAAFFVVVNVAVDLLVALVDPRVRRG